MSIKNKDYFIKKYIENRDIIDHDIQQCKEDFMRASEKTGINIDDLIEYNKDSICDVIYKNFFIEFIHYLYLDKNKDSFIEIIESYSSDDLIEKYVELFKILINEGSLIKKYL